MKRSPSPIGRTFDTGTGVIEITGFARSSGSSARRCETYTSREDGKVYHETRAALDTNDASEPNPGYPRANYSADCACCYLNIPHTRALHDARVASKAANTPSR